MNMVIFTFIRQIRILSGFIFDSFTGFNVSLFSTTKGTKYTKGKRALLAEVFLSDRCVLCG